MAIDYEKLALEYHSREPRGKIYTGLSKPVVSQKDLSVAYSPGVAGPCREIHKNPELSFEYTGRSNLVGVITNGTAVLGLGDIGPEASKPVMEGKAVLFKKFADIDVFDIEVAAKDPDVFIAAVQALEPTFGGINLEDIKAPECFYIEEELRKRMKIPVFHDDQHGTSIIAGSAFLNALEITGRKIESTKVVFSGGGAAAIACANLFLSLGVQQKNIIMCDSKGVLYRGRTEGMNKYKEKFALETNIRTLSDALIGADAFVGVSAAGVLRPEMIMPMAKNPIIFALANPDPEITPEDAKKARPDCIMATGRSDFPNQVNNVLGFPFIFRGALDVQATTINEEMKMAAVRAIARLAKEDVPEQVLRAYNTAEGYHFGRDYLIPKPMDPRVLLYVAPAVAEAAMKSGVARKTVDIAQYTQHIERILGPTKRLIRKMRNNISAWSKKEGQKPRVVIVHGHEDRVIKAAAQMDYEGDVQTILLGNAEEIFSKADSLGIKNFKTKTTIIDPVGDQRCSEFAELLYKARQRKGVTRSAAQHLLRDGNYFASMLVEVGGAEAVIGGIVEPYVTGLKPIMEVIRAKEGRTMNGLYMFSYNKRMYFLADCTVCIDPTSEQLADIAENTARFAQQYTDETIRVALLSFSSFGSNRNEKCLKVANAASILSSRQVNFIFDGEIQADIALNEKLQERDFPFCKLQGQANVLIFPDLSSANIAYKIFSAITGSTGIGPILLGPRHPAAVMERGSNTEDLCNMIYMVANRYVQNQKSNESQTKK
ncbi:MAG: NADP-dependent malic enzyme [Proteobacteria bacterium]|nr:NADP-dependent malic enzyme [Pseudomonadota bacterium]